MDQLQELLTHLINDMEKHKGEVSECQSILRDLPTKNYVSRLASNIRELQESVARDTSLLRSELSMVPKSQVSMDDRDSRYVGRVLSWLLSHVSDLTTMSECKANLHQMKEMNDRINFRMTELRDKICIERASNEALDAVRDSVVVVIKQIGLINQTLSSKLDKVDLTYVENISKRVKDFGTMRDDLCTRLSVLETESKNTRKQNEDQENRIRVLENENETLKQRLRNVAQVSDVNNLACCVVELQNSVDKASTTEQVALLDDQIHNLKSQLAVKLERVNDLISTTSKACEKIQQQVDSKADKEYCSTLTPSSYTEQLYAVTRKELRNKANKSDMLEIDAWATIAKSQHISLERKLDLALRFIDWFSSRGEQYEHNYNIIEKNLADISVKSVEGKPLQSRFNSAASRIASIRASTELSK